MANTDRTIKMEFLTGATGIKINQAHLSNIGRDQHNYYAVQTPMIYNRGKSRKADKDLIELSEFTDVKRGDIYKHKDVGNSWRLRSSNEKDATEAAVYLAEIAIPGHFGTNKFTVKAYRGRQAMKEWRRDFIRCSKEWRGDVPLYGYSRSSVPLLIFHGELIPLAHIEARLSSMGMFYIDLLRSSLGCVANELWIDPAKGRFCRGPSGPECFENYLDHNNIAVPPDLEFLNDDTVIRYFSAKQDDMWFVDALSHAGHCEKLEDPPPTNHLQVISGATNSPIAFNNRNVWWWSGGCIENGELLPDGTIRFYLRHDRRGLRPTSLPERHTWLSQSTSVFHTLNVPSNENLSSYKLIAPIFRLKGAIQKSKCKRKRRQDAHTHICLFFKLSSSFSSSVPFHTWSFDPTGKNPLSPDLCKHFGLPSKLALEVVHYAISWPTKVYVAARDYQIKRGFNPETTDFARHLGSTIYELVPPGFARFQEERLTLPALDTQILKGTRSDLEESIDIPTPLETTQISIAYSLFSHSQLFFGVSGFTKMNDSTSYTRTRPPGDVFGPQQEFVIVRPATHVI